MLSMKKNTNSIAKTTNASGQISLEKDCTLAKTNGTVDDGIENIYVFQNGCARKDPGPEMRARSSPARDSKPGYNPGGVSVSGITQ